MVGSEGGEASAVTAPLDAADAASRRPPRRGESAPETHRIDGRVHHVQYLPAPRAFADAEDRLTFHVVGAGHAAQPLEVTLVEVRSGRIGELVIRDGDQVTVIGKRGRSAAGDTLIAEAVQNHTTHTGLEVQTGTALARRLRAPLGVLWFLAIPAFLLALLSLACGRAGQACALGIPAVATWVLFWFLYQRKAG